MEEPALQSYLLPDETLLWSGAPERKFRFEQKHFPLFFIIPFMLFFFAIPILGLLEGPSTEKPATESQAAQPSAQNQLAVKSDAKAPTSLEIQIVTAVVSVLMIGGFFVFMATCMGIEPWKAFRSVTLYIVTDQRVVVVSGRNKSINSIHLLSLSDLRMKEWPDGLGKISFGPEGVWPYMNKNRGENTLLENIAEPRKVFQILAQARKKA